MKQTLHTKLKCGERDFPSTCLCGIRFVSLNDAHLVVRMKVFAILLIAGLASTEWIPEMENENPHGFGEMSPEQVRYVEGDMLMTGYEEEALTSGVAYTSTDRLWPKSGSYVTVPIENTIGTSIARSRIAEAIAEYKKYTCIRFRKRTWSDKAYLSFYAGGGCSSPVGYHGSKNSISLAGGCMRIGTVMHEIAHSLGIYHEQSRKDRDKYVNILWNNIPSSVQRNFNKYTNLDSHGTAYDYDSMMHYGGTAFGSGKITIETKDPKYQKVIGQRAKMSEIDKKQINAMYGCGGGGGGTPPTKAPPATAPPKACANVFTKGSECPYWAGKGYCISSKWKTWMTKNCAKTCRICTSTACNDNYPKGTQCPYWAGKGYCNSSAWKTWMTNNCKKTCSVCT